MDLLTQIQVGMATLPQELQESMLTLMDTPLSVQEAHALAQLAQTGFIGFQSITNPTTPVGLNDELVPFLDRASDSIALAQDFYSKVRTIDVYISKIPDTHGPGGSGDDFEAELQKAIQEHDESVRELYEAELKSKEIRANIKSILDYGVEISTQPLGVVEETVPSLPRMEELFTPVQKKSD